MSKDSSSSVKPQSGIPAKTVVSPAAQASFQLKPRPVNLNFFTLHFPVTAWVSILHRLSGLFIFLLIPAFLWMLQESLASEARFQSLGMMFQTTGSKLFLWLLLSALGYHLIAGLRHLLMDLHVGESKKGGKWGAWAVLLMAGLGFAFLGVWLW